MKAILYREKLKTETVSLESLYRDVYAKTKFGESRVAKPKQSLIALTNKFELTESLKKICLDFEIRSQLHQNICIEAIEIFKHRIRMAASFMKDYRNCAQQRDDISIEISFLELMGNVMLKVNTQPLNETVKTLLNDAFELAKKFDGATENVRKRFTQSINEACKYSLLLGVVWLDKQIILRYMGFQQEYWCKCSNGHIYCTGEYGAECLLCKAVRFNKNNALIRLVEGLRLLE